MLTRMRVNIVYLQVAASGVCLNATSRQKQRSANMQYSHACASALVILTTRNRGFIIS